MRLIIAFPPNDISDAAQFLTDAREIPGFNAMIAVHANKYETNGPYAYERYA